MDRRRRWLLGLAVAALLLAADAFWLEPRLLLGRDDVALPVGGEPLPAGAEPLRVAHLSDLHLESADSYLARRLVRQVAAAHPDVILVSGDWVDDVRERRGLVEHAQEAAALAAELRRLAPVLSVQGHSDYLGELVAILDRSGVEWLSNAGRHVGGEARGGFLLLGLNQQVGHDAGERPPPFAPLRVGDGWAIGRRQQHAGNDNRYLSWDPAPRSLADAGGPLAWRGYEATVSVWNDGAMDAGVAVHSRYALGEDRFLRLGGGGGSFRLVVDGSTGEGDADTGVAPLPRRWHRLRLRAEVTPREVRVRGKAWLEGTAEPREWQASLADRSRTRAEAGTVALWTQGRGAAAFRDLRVQTLDGRVLLAAALDGPQRPAGWRDGTRATRLALALARSPAVPPGTPRVVLTHSPDAAREAATRGIEAVLAGHTHGGQVRLPGVGALLTRSRLGRRYDRGLFRLDGRRAGGTSLYVNPGVGTSLLPVRFCNPPGWALVTLGGASG